MEKLWTMTEVARYLNITDRDVEGLVKEGKLTGYKLGGKFLRFRPDQVEALLGRVAPRAQDDPARAPSTEPARSRVREFFYFYDFYLLSAVLLASVVIYLIAFS